MEITRCYRSTGLDHYSKMITEGIKDKALPEVRVTQRVIDICVMVGLMKRAREIIIMVGCSKANDRSILFHFFIAITSSTGGFLLPNPEAVQAY